MQNELNAADNKVAVNLYSKSGKIVDKPGKIVETQCTPVRNIVYAGASLKVPNYPGSANAS